MVRHLAALVILAQRIWTRLQKMFMPLTAMKLIPFTTHPKATPIFDQERKKGSLVWSFHTYLTTFLRGWSSRMTNSESPAYWIFLVINANKSINSGSQKRRFALLLTAGYVQTLGLIDNVPSYLWLNSNGMRPKQLQTRRNTTFLLRKPDLFSTVNLLCHIER